MTQPKQFQNDGPKRTFSTGSVRDAATGKGRYDLISPLAIHRLALRCEGGADHYGDRNWEKGQPQGSLLSSAMRHLGKHLMGYRDEDHLAAAMWNIMCMMHNEHQFEREMLPAELDDLPCYVTDEERTDG